MLPSLRPFVEGLVLKSCIWRAGRKAIELRCLAVQLLYIVLVAFGTIQELFTIVSSLFDSDILPIVTSNLDDDEQSTRAQCLLILKVLLQMPLWNGILN